jgi:hypothetical protein
MAKTLIDRIKESLEKEGLEPRTRVARQWLRVKAQNLRVSRTNLMRDRLRLKDKSIIGRMYFYFYDPKLKDTLPYYDRFPLVIPIKRQPDGFIGLNLHYISPKQRIIFLDKLSTILNNHEYDETTRFRISYNFLKASTKMFEAKPCIKKYLFKHIESRFLEITADEWDIAALLPVEFFQKEKKNKVWMESQEQFR